MKKKNKIAARKPTRIQDIGQKRIVIVDSFLETADYLTIQNLISNGSYSQLKSNLRAKAVESPHTSIVMNPNDFNGSKLFNKISRQVLSDFSCRIERINRIYMTQMKFGDNSLVHTDTHGNPNEDKKKKNKHQLTAVIFLNEEWKSDWAGELIFFDNNKDAVCCVSPRPGRIVVAHSSISHRAGIPSRLFYDYRMSLVIMMAVTPSNVKVIESKAA